MRWRSGDLADRFRRELQVHCYRLTGSVQDAEDLVQETLLAAWRGLEGYHPFHAARADLLRRLGRHDEAAAAYGRAATLAPTDAEREFLALGGRAGR